MSRSRRIIALVICFALFATLLLSGVWYLLLGHGWNSTATSIDETMKKLDGYSVVLYEGTSSAEQSAAASASSLSIGDLFSDKSKKSVSSESGDEEAESESSSSESDATGGSSSDESEKTQDSTESSANESSTSASSEKKTSSIEKAIVERFFGKGKTEKDKEEDKQPIEVPLVLAQYQDSGATVIEIDLFHPEKYKNGVIIHNNLVRYGVFSVSGTIPQTQIDAQIKYFRVREVDYIIAICDNVSQISSSKNIDIAFVLDDPNVTSSTGQTIQGIFCVKPSQVGTVGAVIVSSSKTVSAKVITEVDEEKNTNSSEAENSKESN